MHRNELLVKVAEPLSYARAIRHLSKCRNISVARCVTGLCKASSSLRRVELGLPLRHFRLNHSHLLGELNSLNGLFLGIFRIPLVE
jgi:hypothetical protein